MKKKNYIFIYLLNNHPSRHLSVGTHHVTKWTTVKEKKSRKFSPLCPLSCRFGHRRTSTPFTGFIYLGHLVKVMHSPSQTPTIHLACLTSNPLFFKHSFTVSISSVVCPLNDYQHTLVHRLSWRSYPSPSSSPEHAFINPFI